MTRDVGLDRGIGDFALVETLRSWGVRLYCGVGGGSIGNVVRYLEPLFEPGQLAGDQACMLSLGEYVAGFAPIGHYIASRRVAVACAVTGAGSKLISCGMSDAKLHNVPALYMMGLNATTHPGRMPLQDVTPDGINLVEQLRAELGDDCILVEEIGQLEACLVRAQQSLNESRPVALALHPDVLAKPSTVRVPRREPTRTLEHADVEEFLRTFPAASRGRRVIIYVGEEAAYCPGIQALTTRLSTVLKAPTIWSINGANAVAHDNPYGYGYISFGGNDRSLELLRSIGPEDVVITLGFCAGEYSLGCENIFAGLTWHIGNTTKAYGQRNGGFRHRCDGDYKQVRGDVGLALEAILPRLEALGITKERPAVEQPASFNNREITRAVRSDCVDFIAFYEALPKYWRPNSIGFDDVCLSYKDRQYVTQRPHPNIPFWSLHHGSAMGGGFGMGVGAKLGNPALHTFMFCGDGCWRLFGGVLADVANLDLRVFVIDNGGYGIVHQGMAHVMPDVERGRFHGKIPTIDFVAAAKACGWEGFRLKPDLSNLGEIMDACYTRAGQSILVSVPMDIEQEIGPARPLIWRRRNAQNVPTSW
jgi:acetolactate synthase I/II/III large subunit